MTPSIIQLDEMETQLEEARLTEDRLCVEMSSLGLACDSVNSTSAARS